MPSGTEIRPYRPDIDGLRSLAILAVVLAHAGFTTFSGGETGLSTFFVLSGYLVADGLGRPGSGISIGDFYDRRARRLLPTLIVAIAASLVAGALLLAPEEITSLSHSALASAALVSNLLPEADGANGALLHTSTLSVAGQIYLILPLAVLGLARIGMRALPPAVILASMLSFGLGSTDGAGAAQLSHRAWEFGVGALMALVPLAPPKRAVAELLALVGIAAVLAPVFLYASQAPRTGLAALPTVVGTALVIWANRRETATRSVLGASPVVFFGVISYSLYVWHWPILVFSHRIWGEFGTMATLTCLAATVLVATLSWYFIEQPFRYPTGPIRTRSAVLAASLAGVASIAALAAVVAGEGSVADRSGVSAAFAGEGRTLVSTVVP